MTPARTKTWLKIAAEITGFFGLATAVSAWPPVSGLMTMLIDPLFWPIDGGQSLAAPETRLLSAIGGGVMFGWAVMMYLAVDRLFDRDPVALRAILQPGLLCWFAVDSFFSVIAGAPLNVIGNLVFFALFLIPMRAMSAPGAVAGETV